MGGAAAEILFDFQVAPEFVETKRMPQPAISRVPSAEEATQFQRFVGALVSVQFVPEFVEA